MGMDFESWLHQRQPDMQFPNAKSLKLPFDLGMQNTGIPCAIPCTTNAAPVSGGVTPTFGFPGAPTSKVGQMNEPHGWFYGLPRFRQDLMQDTTLHDNFMSEIDFSGKVPALANENCGETNVFPTDAQPAPKQFLVFDRTGNKTTLMLSSMMGASNQPLNSWIQKPGCEYNVNECERGSGSSGQLHSGPNLTNDLDDNNEISKMREDSEDIDALLSSDDEGFDSDDGEEASTGRSPSTMTAYEKQDWLDDNEDMDEVASSAGPCKRQKLSDNGYEAPSVTYTASSYKPKGRRSLEYEDDAESSCAGSEPMRHNNTYSLTGSKRERKEKIRETVSILQTILPSGNGNDAVVVLDDAINYLKTLRFKAESLGISELQ